LKWAGGACVGSSICKCPLLSNEKANEVRGAPL
jgi:hypothetical protein